MKILVDSNIIQIDPTVLAKGSPDDVFVVVMAVARELVGNTSVLPQLLQIARTHGRVEFYDEPTTERTGHGRNLSVPDEALFAAAVDLQAKGGQVLLATEDARLALQAQVAGIRTANLRQLRQMLDDSVLPDPEINKEAESFDRRQKRAVWLPALLGAAISLVANAVAAHIDAVIATITVWGTIALVLATAILAYAVRGRWRLGYGVFEFMFGVCVALFAFWPRFDYAQIDSSGVLRIVTGVLITVRGLDNIGVGLRSSKYSVLWSRLSGEGM